MAFCTRICFAVWTSECRRWPVLVFQPHAAAKTLKMKTGKSHSEKLRIKLRIKIKTRPSFPLGLSASNFYRATRCMGERGVSVCVCWTCAGELWATIVNSLRDATHSFELFFFLRFIFLVWQLCKLSELSTNWYQTFSPWVGRSFAPCIPIFKLTPFGCAINLTHSQQAANPYRYVCFEQPLDSIIWTVLRLNQLKGQMAWLVYSMYMLVH